MKFAKDATLEVLTLDFFFNRDSEIAEVMILAGFIFTVTTRRGLDKQV